MRIAVVGAGISGLSAAWLLGQRHDVVLYEAEGRLGGHSNTVDVETPEGKCPIDTGFIVYNLAAYPNLIAFFETLDVETAASPPLQAIRRLTMEKKDARWGDIRITESSGNVFLDLGFPP